MRLQFKIKLVLSPISFFLLRFHHSFKLGIRLIFRRLKFSITLDDGPPRDSNNSVIDKNYLIVTGVRHIARL